MEVVLKNQTKISESPKKIKLPENTESEEEIITVALDQLHTIANFKRINVNIKVVQVSSPSTITGNTGNKDVIIGDTTATSRVILWESDIDTLKTGKCYTLKSFIVREYNQIKHLSKPREGASVIEIDNIGTVQTDELNEDQLLLPTQSTEITNAQIVGVPQLDIYKSCIRCRA